MIRVDGPTKQEEALWLKFNGMRRRCDHTALLQSTLFRLARDTSKFMACMQRLLIAIWT